MNNATRCGMWDVGAGNRISRARPGPGAGRRSKVNFIVLNEPRSSMSVYCTIRQQLSHLQRRRKGKTLTARLG